MNNKEIIAYLKKDNKQSFKEIAEMENEYEPDIDCEGEILFLQGRIGGYEHLIDLLK
jgi:hypothetical protein